MEAREGREQEREREYYESGQANKSSRRERRNDFSGRKSDSWNKENMKMEQKTVVLANSSCGNEAKWHWKNETTEGEAECSTQKIWIVQTSQRNDDEIVQVRMEPKPRVRTTFNTVERKMQDDKLEHADRDG